jgi:hypothetical protein
LFIVGVIMRIDVFQPASPPSAAAFVAIIAGVIAAFLAGVRYAYRADAATARRVTIRAAVGLGLWLGALSVVVGTGRLAQLPMGGFPIFFGAVLIVSVSVALSPLGARLATLPLAALVAFQAFRLPLELVLHSWVEQGTIPATMTWSGQNWDILSGVVALIAAPWANRHRWAAWIANVIGATLLLNVMRVAMLSAPVPFGWHVSPPLQLVWYLPYALIGPVAVGGALVGHIVLTRALIGRHAARA